MTPRRSPVAHAVHALADGVRDERRATLGRIERAMARDPAGVDTIASYAASWAERHLSTLAGARIALDDGETRSAAAAAMFECAIAEGAEGALDLLDALEQKAGAS